MSARISKQRGDLFERHLETVCRYWKNERIAWVEKKPTAMRFFRKATGDMQIIHHKKSTVDFEGFEFRTGRHICFEVKNVNPDDTRFYYDREHQIKYLFESWRNGCISFLLLRHGEKVVKIIPSNEWEGKQRLIFVLDQYPALNYDKLYEVLNGIF